MKLPAAIAILLLGFGCSSAVPPSPAVSEGALSTQGSLGALQTRDRKVLFFTSPEGVKVSVLAANGAVLAEKVDLDALQTIDPHLYRLCRSGVANRGPYLDATYRPRGDDDGTTEKPSALPPSGSTPSWLR